MKRVLVTGNAGSGKSTLARQIGGALGLTYESLDRIVWQPGWKQTPKDERMRRYGELTEKPNWVIDGVSYEVQSRADTVVFLDVPRRVAFWRVAKRNWKYLFHSRPEVPPRCPELLIIPTLVRIIWNFPIRVRPGILSRITSEQRLFHLKTKEECLEFLAMLKQKRPNQALEPTPGSVTPRAK